MSMSGDHDDALDDEVLRQVVRELRRPVRLDPALDERVLARLRAEPVVATVTPIGRRWGVWMAGAAAAAGLLLSVALPERQAPVPAPVAIAPEPIGESTDARRVRLQLASPASRVAVVGDFNDWDPAATPLRRAPGGGTWVVELRLPPGRYHYTFLIDGRRWARDPSEPPAPDSDFGAPVSVLTVS
jgi:hypothetical protein